MRNIWKRGSLPEILRAPKPAGKSLRRTDLAGYDRYMEDYRRMLKVERTAVEEMTKEQ